MEQYVKKIGGLILATLALMSLSGCKKEKTFTDKYEGMESAFAQGRLQAESMAAKLWNNTTTINVGAFLYKPDTNMIKLDVSDSCARTWQDGAQVLLVCANIDERNSNLKDNKGAVISRMNPIKFHALRTVKDQEGNSVVLAYADVNRYYSNGQNETNIAEQFKFDIVLSKDGTIVITQSEDSKVSILTSKHTLPFSSNDAHYVVTTEDK
jgi:hypothetical protein